MRRRCLLLLLACALASPASASAVVGGQAASRDYPATAALNAKGTLRCGASLVAPSWVLTAAHCVVDTPASDLSVLLGAPVRSRPGPGSETIGVTQAIVHERYGAPNPSSNDVALLRLARPSGKAPIRLAGAAQRGLWAPGRPALLTGWGSEAFLLGGVTDTLREVDLPIVSDGTCKLSYGLTLGFDPLTMVCAGRLLGVKDACNGDSGGPLMVTDTDGALLQVGVVSYGLGCGYPTQYGVYARVGDTALRDWIGARIADPPAAAPPPARAAAAVRLRIGKVTRSGRRVAVPVSATAPIRGLKVTLARIRSGRRTVLAAAGRARPKRRVTVHVTVGRATSTTGRVRIELRARDRSGRIVTALRSVTVRRR